MTKKSALSILIFFILAFALTFCFSKFPSILFLDTDLKDIICGFGPLLSGLICYQVFKTPTTFFITGTQPLKTWLLIFISAATFIFTNSKNSIGFNVVFACSQIIYCFGEEFGWRHFLQSATNNLNKFLQAFIIGLIWFFWHFSWIEEPLKAMTGKTSSAPIAAIIITTIVALFVISLLLGLLINKTKTILLPTILHFAVKTNLPTITVTLVLVLVAVITWNNFFVDKNNPERNLNTNF